MTRPPQIKGRDVGVMRWRQREIRAAKVTNVQTGERGKREDKTENIKKKKSIYLYLFSFGGVSRSTRRFNERGAVRSVEMPS